MTGKPSWLRVSAMAIAFAAAIYGAVPAPAADIIADWPNVKMPPPPELKPVTLDGKTTALFILDLQAPSCTMAQRPHCVDSILKIKVVMDRARAINAMLAYALPNRTTTTVVDPGLAPHKREIVAQELSGPDKFLATDLDGRLKDRGIRTVIITATST